MIFPKFKTQLIAAEGKSMNNQKRLLSFFLVALGCASTQNASSIEALEQRLEREHDARQEAERTSEARRVALEQMAHETPAATQSRLATEQAAASPNGGAPAATSPNAAPIAGLPAGISPTSIPPCDVDGSGAVMPGGINETQGFFDGPAPYQMGGAAADDYRLSLNGMRYAISVSVNGRVQHEYSGGTFPSETAIRTSNGYCRMPIVPPSPSTIRDLHVLFDHVGQQTLQVTCYRYVSGRPAEPFGGTTLFPNIPGSSHYVITDDSCRPRS